MVESFPLDNTFPLSLTENFAALYDRQHVAIYRYVYGLLGGPGEEAEDLAAETFERAWRARDRFNGSEAAAVGWLFTIARRLVLDTYRRRLARGASEDVDSIELSSPDGSPEERALAQEQQQILWRLVQALPVEPREIVVLRYSLDWRVNQIAQHLNVSENNVSVTIGRILARLRRDLSR